MTSGRINAKITDADKLIRLQLCRLTPANFGAFAPSAARTSVTMTATPC